VCSSDLTVQAGSATDVRKDIQRAIIYRGRTAHAVQGDLRHFDPEGWIEEDTDGKDRNAEKN
jgi:hypothetical protein